ncbi:hypothetical protein MWU58_03235 [Flavobacteriaceae bacterium S0825]|uniref:hypothetical protein n=1 Tax=Gaetbulibacter sp. S0825 TaxID=2720084 RepID=UPI00142F4B19|nr:hypothetical protein [Gaetbulibacter sp. S0825]MCK0108292.1 hypothetical protein [Flavobacteriaceae bacterium S0825]NIX63928.1 hypothetical protein [Gaetbulibacter sp. S0825]
MLRKGIGILFCILCACKDINENEAGGFSQTVLDQEKVFAIDTTFPIGDVRRYGIDSLGLDIKHPVTKESTVTTILDISEELGIEIYFPKGYYDFGLNIDSRKNIKIKFDNSEFSDVIHITNEKGSKSENIILKGTLITYDRFGTYESNNIQIDSLIIKSDKNKQKRNLNSRGLHIYTNTTNLSIDYLQVDGLGDDSINNHAAIAIDGWPAYPKNIKIKKAKVNSSDRHGVYLMGFNHKIDTLIIKNYALGSSANMSLMQGAQRGEEKEFSGIWFNECYSTNIGFLKIETKKIDKKQSDIKFDIGDKNYPILINELYNNNSIIRNNYSGEIIKQ